MRIKGIGTISKEKALFKILFFQPVAVWNW